MSKLGPEIKVGLFAIVALGALALILFYISPDTFDREDTVMYFTRLSDARGIIPKTHVRTNGVIIGRVRSVSPPEDNYVRVEMDVSSDVQIPVGSTLEIRTKGILGDVFIEIMRPKEDKGGYIEPNGYIPVSENAADLQALMQIVGEIAQDVKKVTSSLADVFGSEEGKNSIRDILANIRAFSSDLKEISANNKESFTTIIKDLEKTTTALRGAIGDNQENLQDIVENITIASQDLRGITSTVRDVIGEGNKDRLERIIANLDDSLADFKETSGSIKEVARKVEAGEGSLGRLVTDDKVLVEIEGAVRDIRKVLAPATRLQIVVDYHGEIRQDESTQHYFNMLFKTRPDKYFLLGITDMEEEEIVTKTYPSETGEEGETVVRTREKTLDALRFNLQYARRFYFAQLRFGLFESTGGIATDLFFWDDNLKFTFEAFDWQSKDNELRRVAHLKFYTSILFYNHVYAMVGIDDITRKKPGADELDKPNFFFGAGLSFNDDDLKAIFGTAALVSQ